MTNSAEKKSRLGKGLRALIPERPSAAPQDDSSPKEPSISSTAPQTKGETGKRVMQVAVEIIETNPDQPRKNFREDELRELAESIKTYGVIQPLLVRREGERLVLVAGERRLRASIMAGLKTVPVIEGDERSAENSLRLALVENIQRVDLNPVEEARAFMELKNKHGLTQEQIADEVGKSRPYVANSLRLLKLPAEASKLLALGALSVGHAKVLLEVEDPLLCSQLAAEAAAKNISVAELTRNVKRALAGAKSKKSPYTPGPDIRKILQELESRVGARMSLKMRSPTKGELILHYGNLEELQRILSQLKK